MTTTEPGGQLGGIGGPYDVEADMFDRDGSGRASFWVADQSNQRFVQFSYAGGWLQTIGRGGGGTDAAHPGHNYPRGRGNGAMLIPTHISVNQGNGRLYVSDPQRCESVWVFSHTGSFLFKFIHSNWKPRGLAGGEDWDGDGQGDIYVVDNVSRRVLIFDKAGNFIGQMAQVLEMNDPRGLDVDPRNGDVVTVSAIKNKVYKFDYPSGGPQGVVERGGRDGDLGRERQVRLGPLPGGGRQRQRVHGGHVGCPPPRPSHRRHVDGTSIL